MGDTAAGTRRRLRPPAARHSRCARSWSRGPTRTSDEHFQSAVIEQEVADAGPPGGRETRARPGLIRHRRPDGQVVSNMTGDGSSGPLPPPVPPDPRERPVVGEGLHRVDQRHQGGAPVPRPRPAAPAGRPRLLRPAGARGPRGAGRPGPAPRGDRLLLLALLVRRAPAPAAPTRRGAGLGRARLSRSAWRGRTRPGRGSGTGRPTGS